MGGLGVVTRAVLSGTPLVVHRRFDAGGAEREAANGVTLISLVAAALQKVDGSKFRKILLGGAAPPVRLAPNVVTTYGLTETCGGVVYDGIPLDGVEVTVGVDDGGPASGEVLVRGPMTLRAYRNGTDPKISGGWLPTGDAGWIDSDGRLHVTGRIEETINTGGEKVWPEAVEAVLIGHPGVREVAVTGRQDDVWGERVVAFVVLKEPASPVALEELRAWTEQKLPVWAAPREIVLLDALPRTPSGKISRKDLS
jgi:O-succinylbenzoic acid--CoA ligase